MTPTELQRAREQIATHPPHMRGALELALRLSVEESRVEPAHGLNPELHVDLLASLFRVPGTAAAVVEAYARLPDNG